MLNEEVLEMQTRRTYKIWKDGGPITKEEINLLIRHFTSVYVRMNLLPDFYGPLVIIGVKREIMMLQSFLPPN